MNAGGISTDMLSLTLSAIAAMETIAVRRRIMLLRLLLMLLGPGERTGLHLDAVPRVRRSVGWALGADRPTVQTEGFIWRARLALETLACGAREPQFAL